MTNWTLKNLARKFILIKSFYSLINMRQLHISFNLAKTWYWIVRWFLCFWLFLPVFAWCDHKSVLQFKTKWTHHILIFLLFNILHPIFFIWTLVTSLNKATIFFRLHPLSLSLMIRGFFFVLLNIIEPFFKFGITRFSRF